MKSPEAVEKARKYIESRIFSGEWEPGSRLPSIKHIGRAIHVSGDSVQAAAYELAKRGIVQVVRGSGMYAGSRAPIQREPAKWQDLRIRIEKDFALLDRHVDRLPPLTRMMTRYGVSYPTVSKALRALVRDKVLSRNRKGFIINSRAATDSCASIVFITPRMYTLPTDMVNERYRSISDHLQLACRDAGISLRIADTGTFLSPTGSGTSLTVTAIGYVVLSLGNTEEELRLVLERAGRGNLPLAIIDEIGSPEVTQACARYKQARVFTLAGRSAGRQVGRHLLDKGYQTAVYLSEEVNRATSWSLQRLAGLSEAFTNAGFPDAVHEMFLPAWFVTKGGMPANLRSAGEMIQGLGIGTIARELDQRLSGHLDLILEAIARINLLWGPDLSFHRPQTLNAGKGLDDILFYESMMVLCGPLLATLLERRPAPAWVASNDSIAQVAYGFLKERKAGVPEEITLISFNDSLIAERFGITSYNFAVGGVARLAVTYIVNPRHARFNDVQEIEHEGMLNERRTG